MADTGYYYGWECQVYLAVESTYGTASTTGGDYIQPAYIRSVGWKANENIEKIYVPGGSSRRGHEDEVKGAKEVTASVEFWMADDFGAAGLEPFLCKFALDKYNVAVATSTWSIPETGGTYPGDSTFGSYSLLPFTFELGWSKSADIRTRVLTGCYVASETVKCEMGEKVSWTWDIVAQNVTSAAAYVGTGTQATGAPLDWSGVRIKWTGENDTATYHTGCEGVEWTVDNKLEPLMELVGVTQDRMYDGFYTQGREITGTMKWKKKTTAGQKWLDILFSATTGKTTADDTIQLGALLVEMASGLTASATLIYTLADIIIGELPEDIEFDKVSVLSIPFSSRSMTCALLTANTTQEPTNWDSQVA